jgi:ATP synthase protein I
MRCGTVRVMPNINPQGNGRGGNYANLFGVGLAFILIVAVFAGVGFLVDSLLGTLPLFLLIGIVIGFIGWLYYLYRAFENLGGR